MPTLKCPICRKAVEFGSPLMPFCSERCKLIDLGMWSDEEYRISTPADKVELLTAKPEAEDEE